MSPVTGVAIYFIMWWMVLFVVLPFGVTTHAEAGGPIEPGTVSSAPVKPYIRRKVAATTVIAAALWLAGWLALRL